MTTGWIVGYMVGGIVVVIVAVLAITLIVQARKIGAQAADILTALDEARGHTLGLWEVEDVNRGLERVVASAQTARRAAGGGGA